MMISVVLCKINEEINCVNFPQPRGPDSIVQSTGKTIVKSWQKFVATDVMLGIYSLIWPICHKLMWFHRNAVLFHIIFVVTHGEIFSHLSHMGLLTVNKMALPSMYRGRWRHIHAFIGRNTIEPRVQRFAAGDNIICLNTPQTDELSLVLWSTVSQNLRPLGAARTMWVYFTLCQQSTLWVRIVLEVLAKLMVRENSSWDFPKVGVRLILEVHLIFETRRYR